jgi:tRNA 2-selenouridine synthase
MNDVERQRVGTAYKNKGQEAAIALGHQLVSGDIKQQRIAAWAEFARAHPDGYLYCFRGGLRSKISQEWLASEAGIAYPRVVGGYKAMRTFLIDELETAVRDCLFILVGGLTGTGKTEVLDALDNAVDLEQLANHRGSSFGKRATAQPGQIDFENALAIDLLKRRDRGQSRFVLEDEARIIGSCALPLSLYQLMQNLPLVWLEDTFESRVERILRNYVVELSAEFVEVQGEETGFAAFSERLRQSLANIVKRLGIERYQRLDSLMTEALEQQGRDGKVDLHRAWIEALLNEYYDPMYAWQREQKVGRIVFSGPQSQVIGYLQM